MSGPACAGERDSIFAIEFVLNRLIPRLSSLSGNSVENGNVDPSNFILRYVVFVNQPDNHSLGHLPAKIRFFPPVVASSV
jgi:hypothetical protein